MGNNLFISYDLMARGQDYERVAELIKQLGPWARVQRSLWYVNSRMNAEEAGKFLRSGIDGNDQLIVIDASGNNAYWYSNDNEVTRHMMEQWYK